MTKITQKIESAYPTLGELEVPVGVRIEHTTNRDNFITLEVHHTYKGKEYLLVREDCWIDGFKKIRPERRWFNHKEDFHRDEKDGPAIIDPVHYGAKSYMKNGKRHCTIGPAWFTCANEQLYFLEGVQLSKKVWEDCVKNNNCKPPKKTKYNLKALKDKAAQLASDVVSTGLFDGKAVDANDLKEFGLAANPKSWVKYDESTGQNSSIEVLLNCNPLDDTLRFYATINNAGVITNCYLSIE